MEPVSLSRLFIALSLRTALVALFLIVGLRLMGKRQMGQMNIYDLALIMLLANAVQNAMTEGSGHLGAGFVSAGTLLFIGAAFSYLFVRLPRLESRVVGVPTLLISDGKLLADAMRRENVTRDQLMQALREHDLFRIDQVRIAMLEPDGSLSIVPVASSDASKERSADYKANDAMGDASEATEN